VSPYWAMVPVFAAGAYVLAMPARAASPRDAGAMGSIVSTASEKLFTSMQDKNTIMALMHVTEAMVLVDAVRRMADDYTIAHETGVDIMAFNAKAEKHRQALVVKLSVHSSHDNDDDGSEEES
jgi:hypothetical protein